MARNLPPLPMMGLGQIVSPDQLRNLGFSVAGGAVGAVGGPFVVDLLRNLPVIKDLPSEAHVGIVGAIGALAVGYGDEGGWRSEVAKGIAAHLVGGQAVGGLVNRLLGRALSQLPEEEELAQIPGEEELAQLPSPDLPPGATSTDVDVNPAELADLEPTQQFQGQFGNAGFGSSVEEQPPLGSWLQ